MVWTKSSKNSTYKRALKAVGCRYNNVVLWGKEKCTYCGWDAFDRDHVPNVVDSYCYGLKDYPHILVPCCKTCNLMLGGRPYHDLKSRAEFLHKRYYIKYRKFIDLPIWSDEDISEMGPIMQRDLKELERMRLRYEFIYEHLDKLIMALTLNHKLISK